MKNICMIAYTNYCTDARTRREADALVHRGYHVDFIALSEANSPSFEILSGVRIFRVNQSHYQGSGSYKYFRAYLMFFLRATILLFWHFIKERYDVVYFHTMPDFLVFVGLLPKLFGAKVVLDIHDLMPELYISKFAISERHPFIWLIKAQERLSARFADKVICVHHPHKTVLMKRGVPEKKITVLLNLPDPLVVRRSEAIHESNHIIRMVYHGTIAKRLGLDLAVKAFAKMYRDCPNARLDIYGEGDFCQELSLLINHLDLNDRVLFNDKPFRLEDIIKQIAGASIGIIPNRKDIATEYMLPVKLLEYVYLGIPTIAPRLYTIEYYFANDQLAYYEAENINDLASAMRNLYFDETLRHTLAQNALRFVEKYSWETMKEELFTIVNKN
jgi:glycosyltransferase involved in cell wall biosynthesis